MEVSQMKEGEVASLDDLFDDTKVDKIGVVRLEDWKGTPLWDYSRKYLTGAKSVIVLMMEVFPEVVKYLTSKHQVGEVALRDLYKRNLNVINGHIDWEAYKIIKKLHELGYKGLAFTAGDPPTDNRLLESAFSYKYAAQAAGLGVIGWHGLLITPEYGSRLRLSAVVTDAPLQPSAPSGQEHPCIKCGGACIKICPASAIKMPGEGEEYNNDKYACFAYCSASEGCSECLKACPVGKSA